MVNGDFWKYPVIICTNLYFKHQKLQRVAIQNGSFFDKGKLFLLLKFLILTWFILRHKVLYGTHAQMMIKVFWSCNSLFTPLQVPLTFTVRGNLPNLYVLKSISMSLKPSIRDGVLRSGTLLYLHLILK